MTEVSLFRLYLLRATYLLIVVGLGLTIWPSVLSHPVEMSLMRGVVHSVLGAVSLLALIGLRYPLQMLPLMLYEIAWKTIWLTLIAGRAWMAGKWTPDIESLFTDCIGIVIAYFIVPWRYVWARYVVQAMEPLRAPEPR